MSREPSWDLAQRLQAEMFDVAAHCGGLDIQLVYFRGFNECRASRFIRTGRASRRRCGKFRCAAARRRSAGCCGHVRSEQADAPVGAFIYIGDAMEEKADDLARVAGELGLRGVKGFFFQEGANSHAAACFKDFARLTGGAYAAFDTHGAGPAGRLAQGRRSLCGRRFCRAGGPRERGRGGSAAASGADALGSGVSHRNNV